MNQAPPLADRTPTRPLAVEAENLIVRRAGGLSWSGRPSPPVTVLDGCHLRLEQGLLHGLVGPGGSGKTTLLKTLATLVFPDSGTVRLFGVPVNPADREGLRALRSRIGLQFQNLALFDFLDVGENVAFPVVQGPAPPPPDAVQAEVDALLRAVGLPGTARLRVSELSGGMQRRVALARAVMGRPDLCLLDDPAAGLDPVNSSRIFQFLKTVQRERKTTMVVASHDVDRMARVCDRFHLLVAGRVVFSGTLVEASNSKDPVVAAFFSGTVAASEMAG